MTHGGTSGSRHGKPQPVGWMVTDPADLTAQHRVLVPEYQQFGFLGHLTQGQHHQTGEQTADEQVDAREDHSGMISARRTPPARPDRVIEPYTRDVVRDEDLYIDTGPAGRDDPADPVGSPHSNKCRQAFDYFSGRAVADRASQAPEVATTCRGVSPRWLRCAGRRRHTDRPMSPIDTLRIRDRARPDGGFHHDLESCEPARAVTRLLGRTNTSGSSSRRRSTRRMCTRRHRSPASCGLASVLCCCSIQRSR
jgi:hypothetical protein